VRGSQSGRSTATPAKFVRTTSETNGGVTHTDVPGDLDHGVGHLGRVRANGLAGEATLDGIVDDRGLLALDGLEGGLATLLDA